MKKLVLHPFFSIGLLIRLVLIIGVTPLAVSEWFAPFLSSSLSSFSLDPWGVWRAGGGDLAAFPYGYAMWLTFLPLSLLAELTGFSQIHAYALTLLVADFLLLLTINHLLPLRQRLVLVAYWLSPVIILATYGFGLNDLVPALMLLLSILFVRRYDLKMAGVLLAVAISAKLSMIVALPFFVIYLVNNKALRQLLRDFVIGFGAGSLVFGTAFLFSAAGLEMLLGNPEMGKIYQLSLELTGNVSIFIVPLAYLVMLYFAWRVRRMNFDLFQVTIGITLLFLVILTPASPGWFVWSIPFLVLYQAIGGRIAVSLVFLFSGVYVLGVVLERPLYLVNGVVLDLAALLPLSPDRLGHVTSLLYTGLAAIGLVLAIRVWREAIGGNDFFRLSRKPFSIGIAGDSGAGKDTFVDALTGLFGTHSVVKLSGDDYHLWDRQKPIWQVMTHLNPMSNDLEGYSNDLVALTDGKKVLSRHYDHATGKMSKPFLVKSNDFIIASGLHALFLPVLRESYNLKIYLDIDEGLRRKFKIDRDVKERGHALEKVLAQFERRARDSERFIRPQARHADLVLSLQPIHPRMLEGVDKDHPLRLKLVVTTGHGFNELSMHRVLVGVCGLHVDIVAGDDGADTQLTIEGEVTSEDLSMAADMLFPRIHEFLDVKPEWQDGMLGLMQLITLSHINQILTKRIIE